MTAYRVFSPFGLVLIAVVIAAVVLGVGSGRNASDKGVSFFKKQAVAWGITLLMVFAAIGIGAAAAPTNDPKPESMPGHGSTVPPMAIESYVRDDAGVLSNKTEETLNERNARLWNNYQVTVGVVTCDYDQDDLGGFAMEYAEDMGLGGYDMIVVLDISGDNYWLLQGNDIRFDFTDDDCSDYTWNYLEKEFAKGNYDSALLKLTDALEDWYDGYFD